MKGFSHCLKIFSDFNSRLIFYNFLPLAKKVTFILKMELRLKVELGREENRGYEQIIKLKFPGSQKS